jgi:hypothetical protein
VLANLPVSNFFSLVGETPPIPQGGTIRDGRYIPGRIDLYGTLTLPIYVQTYEFRDHSVQLAEQDVAQLSPLLNFLPEFHYTGTFTTSGTSLSFNVSLCEIQFDGIELQTQRAQYTATANGLIVTSQTADGTMVVSYVRQ